MPAFSTTGATGNTTSARSVTALSRSSRLTTNGAASIAGQRRVRVGQVGELDAADQQRAQFAAGRRGEDARGVAARRASGSVGDVPRRGDLLAGGRVGDRTAAGQQVGQRAGLQRAAVAGASRHPAQPGAGGRRPAVLAAE